MYWPVCWSFCWPPVPRIAEPKDRSGQAGEGDPRLGSDDTQAERLRIREDTLSAVEERLDLVDQQELRAEKFIYRSRLSEDALAKTRIELAALKAGSSETAVTVVSEALQKTIDQAKEVQEELRRLGF